MNNLNSKDILQNKNIGILGGDLRTAYLADMLGKENNVYLYGMEKCELLKNYKHIETMQELFIKSDIIITAIPLSKDGENINATFTNKKIKVNDLLKNAVNKKIITGNISKIIKENIDDNNVLEKNNQIIDILEDESLTIFNAIPTAEGAIQIAMEQSDITLHNSKCLVLGFGRIGKILAKMLDGLGAQVYCEARKQSDIAWIKTLGYNDIELNNLNNYLEQFDFIFNTIPYLILDKNNLSLVKKECVIIDLASKPGGIDFDEANNLNIKNIWALALPGKVAPKTAAKYIFNTIRQLL